MMSKTRTFTISSRLCAPGSNNNNTRSHLTFLLALLIILLPSPSIAFPSTQLSSSSSSWDAASLDHHSIRRQHRRQISSSSKDAAFSVDNSRPPAIRRQRRRQDVVFDAREDLRLICDAVGVPAIHYEWRKNGALLNIDKHPNASLALGTGDLIIKNPGVMDEGYYQCVASNRVGTSLSNVFNVRSAFLDQMPKVTSPKVRAGKVGGHVTLTCSTPHSLPEADIFWTHEGEDSGFEAMLMTETLAMDPKGNLHFLQLSPEDDNDGWPYTCNILNKIMRSIQQGDDQIIELTDIDDVKDVKDAVIVPATLLYAPDPATFALRGATLKLMCIFAGNPIPKIIWKRDGKLIDSSSSSFSPSSHLHISDHNRILAIRNVQPDDAGRYECIGANNASLSATTAVTVEAAPFFYHEAGKR